MADVSFKEVDKVYENGFHAVKDLSLDIFDGEFLVLVGPSGCGKTTALRMIAGLEDISDGTLSIGGRVVNDLNPKERDIAMVFQNYALYPHLSVAENIAFGLRLRKASKSIINERVAWAARMLDLTDYLDRRPKQLSGGQRQRVAMGRAIVRQPQVFLMDEPLSNLDAKLRVQMRAEIARIQRDLKVTTIYVTHDQSEAMTLGDRVCVLRGGILQQVARPQVLYDRPANLFVAGFIGSPAMNLVEAELAERDGGLAVTFGPHELPVTERAELRPYLGRRVALGVRPEDLGGHGPVKLDVTIDIKEDMGHEIFLHFAVDAPPVKADELKEIIGDEALAAADEQTHHHGSPFIARVERGNPAREGEQTQLAVDTSRLHFFDLETGAGIHAADRELVAT